jgi:hypothetical protein
MRVVRRAFIAVVCYGSRATCIYPMANTGCTTFTVCSIVGSNTHRTLPNPALLRFSVERGMPAVVMIYIRARPGKLSS